MLEINNEQFYLLLYLMGLHPLFTSWLYHLLYKYCILINQQQKHSKQSTLPEWLTDWPTDWLTDRQFDWLTTWFVVIVVVMNHILRSPFLELIVEFLVRRFIQCYNKKWRHFSWRNMEIKYIYIYAKNSFGSSVESEFLLGYLNGNHRFSVGHKNFFLLVLLRAIYDFHTIKSLRLRRRWEMMRTEWSSSSSTCPKTKNNTNQKIQFYTLWPRVGVFQLGFTRSLLLESFSFYVIIRNQIVRFYSIISVAIYT